MGFWSNVWQKVKAVARTIVRVVVEIVGRVFGLLDLLLGFIAWPPKKMRLHIVVLSQTDPNSIPINITSRDINTIPVINPIDLNDSIDYAKKTLKEKFNVDLIPYIKTFVQVDTSLSPDYALNVECNSAALSEEYSNAGEFFASKIAGWNAIPISLTFPITVFVVLNVKGKQGCSLGPLTDYVTIDLDGVNSKSTLMHEIGHSCGLWHSGSVSNIMYADSTRGNNVKGFQKNLLRSSRHVLYW